MFTKTLEGAAEDAGVDRPVTFTSFRKSSASYLASQGMNQAHIEDHHGWVRGSDVTITTFPRTDDSIPSRIYGGYNY